MCKMTSLQVCYGVETIPEGEWLCWPCLKHEEGLRKKGLPQAEIRPPRLDDCH